jgi:hypothetical protein
MAIILALLISTIFGKRIIRFLQKQQVGETIRDLGLEGQVEKAFIWLFVICCWLLVVGCWLLVVG